MPISLSHFLAFPLHKTSTMPGQQIPDTLKMHAIGMLVRSEILDSTLHSKYGTFADKDMAFERFNVGFLPFQKECEHAGVSMEFAIQWARDNREKFLPSAGVKMGTITENE